MNYGEKNTYMCPPSDKQISKLKEKEFLTLTIDTARLFTQIFALNFVQIWLPL